MCSPQGIRRNVHGDHDIKRNEVRAEQRCKGAASGDLRDLFVARDIPYPTHMSENGYDSPHRCV